MWVLKNTFGVITLQVGTISFSSVFITLAACILLVNSLSLNKEEQTGWTIMFVFIFIMTVIWSIAFVGACKELKNLISTATVLWAGYVVLWSVFVISSFIQPIKKTCVGSRCPNSLWLVNNSWNDLQYSANEKTKLRLNYGGLPGQKPDENTESKCKNVCKYRKMLIDKMRTNNEVINKLNETPMTPSNQHGLIVSIILTVLYASMLLYSWAILFSYLKEIQRTINVQTQ